MTERRTLRAGGHDAGTPAPGAAGPLTYMADISEFEPDIADAVYLQWSKAVAIRALYGANHADSAWYGGQRRSALHAGGARVVLIYQYLAAGQPGAAQAQAFHGLVGAIEPGEIFVADFEEGARSALTDWYDAMHSLYGPGIAPYLWTYTGLDFGEAEGVLPVEWIAAYGQAEPASPHKLWQFTSSLIIPGIGTADCSLFHGSIDDLAALAYQAAPQPPPAWVFGPVRSLKVNAAGPHSVALSWDSPGTPAPLGVGWYQVTIRRNGQDVPGYPRTVAKVANPEAWHGGSLQPATPYEALVRAVATDGGHASPWATAEFTTATG